MKDAGRRWCRLIKRDEKLNKEASNKAEAPSQTIDEPRETETDEIDK